LQANAAFPALRQNPEQIFGGGIAGRTEHPHQALGRPAERRAEFFKTDRGADAGARRGVALVEMAVEKRLRRLDEQGLLKFDGAARPLP
jgi:hypothetical protein